MTGKREQNREQNRLALIEAVLDSVAEKGISETSVSEIIQRAGLSRGMIHLHFGGKDNLVQAAVQHSSEDYYGGLENLLQTAGDSGQERIEMIIRGDLSKEVLNRRSVSIWYAFRGEARNRAAVAEFSDTRDDRLRSMILHAFTSVVREDGCPDAAAVARDATHGTLALLEGMWTDYLLHPDRFDREEAMRIIFRFLAAMFPAHFSLAGAILPEEAEGAAARPL
ncbi:TetR family transcriptional regulator C-terminal domain-containing protein [Leisingera sp. ANG-Vp]|uniref:TetR family transcriptional regulator C-terminal domain-containing protein n=1 Tax=Leisingera sp. ANG-Vp TaxID=1577896 RepID=UPI00057DE955|nr:TetR family transcriptional regulator C-terminal domain-containing protein [Leisingera sp. ANG-Vp]KIC21129.1 transcriptional regulator [Leisingera sp. ANG-Vp]